MRTFSALLCSLLLSVGLGAQDGLFNRLVLSVKSLCAPEMEGRKAGSDGEQRAALFIGEYFKTVTGTDASPAYVRFQDFSVLYGADTIKSQNVVAIVEGCDSILKREYIVVGAHYDHLGANHISFNDHDSLCVYPGANSNASGVAALMEVAREVAANRDMFRRSIVFVAFGAEEIGCFGSWYFVNRAFNMRNVKMMVNLDMMGGLGDEDVKLYNSSEFPFASDHNSFVEKGVASYLFTSGYGNEHNSLRDVPETLDYNVLAASVESVFSFLLEKSQASVIDAGTLAKGEGYYSLSEVDRMPSFMNSGFDSFQRWFYKYLKYPESAVNEGVQGTVNVSFIIEADGRITNVAVERSVSPALDAEAVKVVSASPKWKAAVKNGNKVRVKCTVPVYFRLRKAKKG